MIKGSMHKKEIMMINVCTPNTRAPKYTKQLLTELKAEKDSSTIVIGNFSDPLSPMDGTSRMIRNQDINNTTDQMDVTNIYTSFHPITK